MTRKKTYLTVTMMTLGLALAGCAAKTTGKDTQTTAGESANTETAAREEAGGQPSETQLSETPPSGPQPSESQLSESQSGTAITFTDGLGNEVHISPTDQAAVLSGSFAQAWLLAGGRLDAVTEDVYSERDVEIPDTVTDLGMVKSPNMEALVGSGATFAILSSNIERHVALLDFLEKTDITSAYFDVETFDDYLNMMKIFTDITGRPDLYKKNGTDIQSEIDEQIARADGSQPVVLLLRAFSTGVRAKGSDNMTGEMLKDLGCINIADSDQGLLDDLSMESIIARDPDYIFVTTMGNSEEDAMKSVEDLLQSNPAWKELSAVKNGRYHVLPKALFHNKPNNRWGESYQILADILYGENKSKSN